MRSQAQAPFVCERRRRGFLFIVFLIFFTLHLHREDSCFECGAISKYSRGGRRAHSSPTRCSVHPRTRRKDSPGTRCWVRASYCGRWHTCQCRWTMTRPPLHSTASTRGTRLVRRVSQRHRRSATRDITRDRRACTTCGRASRRERARTYLFHLEPLL